MKPLNRKSAINLLAIVEVIILIPLFYLMGMGKMSNTTFILTLFTLLFLTLAAIVFILYKYPAEKKNDFDPDSVEVSRSRCRTVIEVITGIIVVSAWVIALATRHFIGDDGSILYREIFYTLMCTSFIVFILINVYTPSSYDLAGKLTNAKQVSLAVLMYRILALLCSLFLLTTVIPALHSNWLALCWIILAVGTFIVFRILLYKAKNK